MKKLWIGACLAGALWAYSAQAAYDGTISLQPAGGNNAGGGAFQATATGFGTFLTFCVEDNENFGYGYTYKYRVNNGSVAGGVSGQDGIDSHTLLTMDSLSLGTAWLYSQYRSGALFGGNGTDTQKNDLQAAIWWLEGETPVGSRNYLIDTAEGALGNISDSDLMAAAGSQNYGVRILNLFDGAYSQPRVGGDGVTYDVNQDMLAIVPEPTTMVAGMLLLLPFGASATKILRKKATA